MGGLYAREGDIISSAGRTKQFSGRMGNIWRILSDVTYPIVAYTTVSRVLASHIQVNKRNIRVMSSTEPSGRSVQPSALRTLTDIGCPVFHRSSH